MIYPDYRAKLTAAADRLAEQFPNLNWNFRPVPEGGRTELISQWLGDASEDIMVVTFKGKRYIEKFHKQDFFFINFVVQNGYDVLSSKFSNRLHLSEGDCYIGQPYSGYALKIDGSEEVIMVGLHIKNDLFYREYLKELAADSSLFHFFLDPQTNRFSDEYIRLHLDPNDEIWAQLYLMLLEYAGRGENSQAVLRSMMLTLTMYISRAWRRQHADDGAGLNLALQMAGYIESHSDSVTLKSLAAHFGYHPGYVSAYLHKALGKRFSDILLEKRMEKARLLLSSTDLSVEKIADMLGYRNPSNFYKAFRSSQGMAPRAFAAAARAKVS
ncbi:MAG: AraC family transcriptional regulator [Burkholderia sp.]